MQDQLKEHNILCRLTAISQPEQLSEQENGRCIQALADILEIRMFDTRAFIAPHGILIPAWTQPSSIMT